MDAAKCANTNRIFGVWLVFVNYFDMYIQQRFVATEMEEFEVVSNTLCTTFM